MRTPMRVNPREGRTTVVVALSIIAAALGIYLMASYTKTPVSYYHVCLLYQRAGEGPSYRTFTATFTDGAAMTRARLAGVQLMAAEDAGTTNILVLGWQRYEE